MAKEAGRRDAGHFTQILNGKANISVRLIECFADFMRLDARDHLVRFAENLR